ncbi:alpha/beta hydrolase [Chryseolinea lacunae]|uniref:Alpha/beta hydrolase n=1 Tax=Chryseolinea lacunae TaxID=2801331 RepID=A0ABS1L0W1_9BACT|nr:alpha/beta hydrolase [Chryseolinea lacunae]MBL0745351.1 alpha/beta hydrolase [Chryseolinea lacunae]
MTKIKSKTIVFITGAFVSHSCWEEWATFFQYQGYTTLVPPWPAKDADAETLRCRHPDAALAAVSLPDVIAHYTKIVQSLHEKPIVIGHSFGGLIAQIMLNKGFAAACVALHAVPPQGVIPYEFNFLKSNIGALGFFTSSKKTFLMSFEKWQFVFTNGLPFDVQRKGYFDFSIPESKRVLRGGLTSAAAVDFAKAHAPLLIVAGSQDHCIPSHLCKRVFKKYSHKESVTDFVEKDRNHFVLGLPTWKADATHIVEWLRAH